MTNISRTVKQYSLTPESKHYWDLAELFKEEDISPGEGYYARDVDIHHWERQARPRRITKVPGYQRLYSQKGSTAHLVIESASPSDATPARCGIVPSDGVWRGTGNQAEIEILASRHDCRSCMNIIKLDNEEAARLKRMTELRKGRP